MEIGEPVEIDHTCPWCMTRHELASQLRGTGAPPRDGDVSVCIYCYRISVFRGGALEQPDAAVMRELLEDQDIHDLIFAMRQAHTLPPGR